MVTTARRWRATAATAASLAAIIALSSCSDPTAPGGGGGSGTTTITVALAANPQMKTAESLISDFEAKNPGITVKFTTLPENDLRPPSPRTSRRRPASTTSR
jgi:sorbitol/mannitol transport system substrate-binding protein